MTKIGLTKRGAIKKPPTKRASTGRAKPQARSAKASKPKHQVLPAPPAAVAQPHPWVERAKNAGFIGALLAGLGLAVWGGTKHSSPPAPVPPSSAPVPPIVELQPQPPVKFEIPKAEVEKEPVVTPQTLPPPPALDSGPGRKRRH